MKTGIELLADQLSFKYGNIDLKNPLHIAEIYHLLLKSGIPVEIISENIASLNEAEELSDKVKKKAKKLGLVWKRQCYGKEGEEGCTHKVEDNKLVPMSDASDADDTSSEEESGTAVKGAEVSHPFVSSKEKDAVEQKEAERQAKIEQIQPKGLRDILNKNTAGYRNNVQYLNSEQKEIYDKLLDDIIDLQLMEDGPEKQELARRIVDEYGLERNTSG